MFEFSRAPPRVAQTAQKWKEHMTSYLPRPLEEAGYGVSSAPVLQPSNPKGKLEADSPTVRSLSISRLLG